MSIRSKLIFMFLIVALIPALLVGLLSFNNYKNSLKASELDKMRDIAAFKADKIESYFSELKTSMRIAQGAHVVTNEFPVLIRLAPDKDNPDLIAAKQITDGPLQNMQRALSLRAILGVNPEGKIIYASNPELEEKLFLHPLPHSGQEAFARGKSDIFLSDVFINHEDGDRPEMLLTAPFRDGEGAFIGEVSFLVDTKPLADLITDTTGLGSTGETLLVRKEGNAVLFLSAVRHEQAPLSEKRIPFGANIGTAAQEAAQGKSGTGITIDYRGKKVIAAWTYLPVPGWGIVSKIDMHEAFADIDKLGKLIVLSLLLITLFAGIMAFSMAKSIADPLKGFMKGAQIIGSGNLDFTLFSNSRDEIGALAESFNSMTRSLKAMTASRDELNEEMAERKQVEELLAKNRQELQVIFDSVPALIFYKDKNNCFQRVNTAFAEVMKMEKLQLEGKCLYDLYPHEQAEAYWKDDLEVISSGKAKMNISEPLQTSREELWVRTDKLPYYNDQGEIIGVIGFSVDITEQRKAEAALRKSYDELEERVKARTRELADERQRLYAVLETLPVYVVLLTPDYHLSFANKVFRERFGENGSSSCSEFLFKRKASCENCESYKVLNTNAPHQWAWVGPDGRSYDIYDFPFRETDGSIHIMEMGIDVTERRRAEEELLKAKDTLLEAKRLTDIGTLAATVAHELRNPLAAIKMAAYNIKRKTQGDLLDGHLKNIDIKVNESEQIISNLLFYSRLKMPKLDKINVHNILSACITEVESHAAKADVSVERNMGAIKDTLVQADALQMKEVFTNILNNAFDALPAKGGTLSLRAIKDLESVTIVIRDNGEGIDANVLPRVFEPFFTTKAKGTGLGLSLCQQIVRLHNGEIRIESEKGSWTQVTITLPLLNG